MLVELANDMEFHMGKDKYGKDWVDKCKISCIIICLREIIYSAMRRKEVNDEI